MGINIEYESGETPLSEKKSEVFIFMGQLYRTINLVLTIEPGQMAKVTDRHSDAPSGKIRAVCIKSGNVFYFNLDTPVTFVGITVDIKEV